MTWTKKRYDRVADRSAILHGHRHVLPVVAWILESGSEAITAPEATHGLAGLVTGNKVLEALERLDAIGALRELPYPGKPHRRVFERIPSPYWDFAGQYLSEVAPSKRAKRRR